MEAVKLGFKEVGLGEEEEEGDKMTTLVSTMLEWENIENA